MERRFSSGRLPSWRYLNIALHFVHENNADRTELETIVLVGKGITFDTGGTILDWHSGFRASFAKIGVKHGLERDWSALTNELRRRSLKMMLRLGEHEPPNINFDDAHHIAVIELAREYDLGVFTEQDILAW